MKEYHRQLKKYLKRFAPKDYDDENFVSCGEDSEALLKCVCAGFFGNCARLSSNGNYRTIRGERDVKLNPSSMLVRLSKVPNWIVFHDAFFTTREYVRDVSAINPHWVEEIASHFYRVRDNVDYLGGKDSGEKKRKRDEEEKHGDSDGFLAL